MNTERSSSAFPQKEPILYIKQLSKQYGESVILRDITMHIYPCEVVSIIGASGSGKSTLLRCINQLEIQTSGKIYFERKHVELECHCPESRWLGSAPRRWGYGYGLKDKHF